MPRKPKRPCAFPGCLNLTDDTYCEEHKTQARQSYDKYSRSPDVHRKYGRAWKRIRDSYAAAHPLCERCLAEGRTIVPYLLAHLLHIILLQLLSKQKTSS